jgi:D-methionine transport system substrate-binding protein
MPFTSRPSASRRAFTAALLALLVLPGCSRGRVGPDESHVIRLGVEGGPHAEIAEIAKGALAKQGITLQISEFSDYTRPNAALFDGDLDANSYQHQPYLDVQNRSRGYDFVSVGKTVVFPIGIYSAKVKSLDALPNGGTIAFPNDPSNGGRSLLLLQANGLIHLKAGSDPVTPSVADVETNPKGLRFVEVDAAQLPAVLPDVAAAVINTNYALQAKLDPAKDAIARESADSPYVNLIVVRRADRDKPWAQQLVAAYHSDEVRKFVNEKYAGVVVPGF